MRLRHMLAASIALVVCASHAKAWGPEGHQIVGLLAEPRLTPAARAGVEGLLGKDDKGVQVEISDAEVVNWADRIRRDRKETGPYHYVDIPVEAAAYDAERDGNKGENLLDKLALYTAVLRDKAKPKADREEALRWVVHMVADLHQPLHCAERNKDSGGNKRQVFLMDATGPASNLHKVWDGEILRMMTGKRPLAQYAASLDKQIKPAAAKEWAAGTPVDWANESHDLAVKYVYDGVPADGPPPRLDRAYVERAQPVIEEQIERGGIRLAAVLNGCFDAKAPTTRPRR